ncbi:flagellar regulator YcgR PilZN domain-containing protein [Ectopseudomonas mendocina]|uniref:Flagellar regulator YcgR PilZN domain-containing protein n=1 Tax=Ectopseudomonas mendocina TaxID=300 RepID=A0ABZ2RKU3_ECTME
MSNPFSQDDGPQPPRTLRAPVEIVANLRLLQQHNDPLVISFPGRSQRYQSFVINVDRDKQLLVLDEIMPSDGERLLLNGESFKAEGFHEGVRIAWESDQPVTVGEFEGHRSYYCFLPQEIIYHQRRNAFRAQLKQTDPVKVDLAIGENRILSGQLMDISATGAKVRFTGDAQLSLHPGEIHESFTAHFPFGAMTTAIEVRHVQFEDKVNFSFVGVRFDNINGQAQRQVERFVYQLQREARRFESEGLF